MKIPSTEEVSNLERKSLVQVLEEVCNRLYRLLSKSEYDTLVIKKVRSVPQGITALRRFVAWTIELLENRSLPQTAM